MSTDSFLPASSKAEAVARLYALAGAPAEPLGPGSKERKSVLTKTAASLGLSVDTGAPKDALALQILTALGKDWEAGFSSKGQTITLSGLNALLTAAQAEHRRRTALEMRQQVQVLPDWFLPARDKLEAVRRISSLTGGRPQELGPGSKERKSVLTDLVGNLSLPVDTSLPKTRLAAAITEALGTPWDKQCWSRGETITLQGLNSVLAGAESVTLHGAHRRRDRLRQEARLLTSALAAACSGTWDGRTCVTQMLESEYPKARQTEWIGWYFEFIGLPALINAFGGGPERIGRTEFDYARSFVWDLKSHAQEGLTAPEDVRGNAPLNDRDAIMQCVKERGAIGFLVLSGCSSYEGLEDFDAWHRGMRGRPASASARPRPLKVALEPVTVQSYVFDGAHETQEALESGSLSLFKQGRQPDGSPRNLKLQMNLRRAREEGRVWAEEPLTA